MTCARFSLQRGLATDTRGATIVEFAIVAPVMALFLAAAFDAAHTLYMRSTLQGIVQKTGRDSSLETSTGATAQANIDAKVTRQVSAIANNATIAFNRRFYRTFTKAAEAKPEPWTDTNKNGVCDASEPYTDTNLNTVWDRDGGDAGQGGAKDKVVYTVTVSYPRMLPIYNWVGGDRTTTLTASTVLANQPYGDQATYGAPQTRYCPLPILAAPTPTPSATTPPPPPTVTPPTRQCSINLIIICL